MNVVKYTILKLEKRDIPCWGQLRRSLTFGLHIFFITFLLAAVSRPIFVLDFLSAHGLLVYPVSHQVLDSKSLDLLSKTYIAAGKRRSKLAAPLCTIRTTNYMRLNLATIYDRYPLPNILDLSNKLHGCKYFSSSTSSRVTIRYRWHHRT
jgi:hypothetical protein